MSKYKFIGNTHDLTDNGFEYMEGYKLKRYELKSLFNTGMSMMVLLENNIIMFSYVASGNVRTLEELEKDKENYEKQIKFVKAKLRYLIDKGLVIK